MLKVEGKESAAHLQKRVAVAASGEPARAGSGSAESHHMKKPGASLPGLLHHNLIRRRAAH